MWLKIKKTDVAIKTELSVYLNELLSFPNSICPLKSSVRNKRLYYWFRIIRSLSLLSEGYIISYNDAVLSSRYGLFFYTYGVYLHCGYEHSFISPHNGFINTSFQHYAHHARLNTRTATQIHQI